MNHPNLEIINGFLQAYTERDPDGLRNDLAEDAKWMAQGGHFFSDPGAADGFFNHVAGVMGSSGEGV